MFFRVDVDRLRAFFSLGDGDLALALAATEGLELATWRADLKTGGDASHHADRHPRQEAPGIWILPLRRTSGAVLREKERERELRRVRPRHRRTKKEIQTDVAR